MDNNSPLLIVGLGNPGKKYSKTRHNIGAIVLEHYSRDLNATLKSQAKLEGFVATLLVEERKVILLLPQTYMNLSGSSVKKCMDYYGIPLTNLLVLSDDTYLPFADVRLKMGGSAGGHNGLKDIENCLGTNKYPRLRIGIGEKTTEDLADYVLQKFSIDEEGKIESIASKCIHEIKKYISSELKQSQTKIQKEDLRRN
jgi:peptidyl-tRNA hydrolase, PTH1 family